MIEGPQVCFPWFPSVLPRMHLDEDLWKNALTFDEVLDFQALLLWRVVTVVSKMERTEWTLKYGSVSVTFLFPYLAHPGNRHVITTTSKQGETCLEATRRTGAADRNYLSILHLPHRSLFKQFAVQVLLKASHVFFVYRNKYCVFIRLS